MGHAARGVERGSCGVAWRGAAWAVGRGSWGAERGVMGVWRGAWGVGIVAWCAGFPCGVRCGVVLRGVVRCCVVWFGWSGLGVLRVGGALARVRWVHGSGRVDGRIGCEGGGWVGQVGGGVVVCGVV